jgi:hypothetical protein
MTYFDTLLVFVGKVNANPSVLGIPWRFPRWKGCAESE